MGKLIVIAGPTASGKTALSIEIAKQFNAAIIGADSRQFYQGMDIGTAKPTATERATVPHHFIDFLTPDSDYSVGQFEREVIDFLNRYFQTNEVAVMVGGSGLFLKAVMEGMDPLPSTPPEVRDQWQAGYQEQGLEFLQGELQRLDPEYAQQVDLQNPQRLLRALEAITVSGKPFSQLRRGNKKTRPFAIDAILLNPDRDWLYNRINQRVDQMMEDGLLREVKQLLPHKQLNALNTVGYKELFHYLDGEIPLENAVIKIKQHTRNFAKRQFTWFRKQESFTVFDSNDFPLIMKHLLRDVHVS